MDRNFQISYCSVCSNHKKDFKKGVYCGITDKRAQFDIYCQDYSFDSKKSKEITDNLKKQINSNYSNKSFLNELLSKEIYEDVNEVKPNNKIIKKHYKKNLFINYIVIVLFVGYAIYYINEYWNEIIKFNKIETLIILFSIIVVILIELATKKNDSLSITKYGIITNETKVPWNDILIIGNTSKSVGEGFTAYKIILGTKSRGLIEIDVSEFNITAQELFKIIKTGIKNVA
ncbi:hypothetical protein IZU89_01840 [Cellulophaga lytica]|uniref:hypothetical protein n=1 Tax=Cellulophaga lytica TaxID=979 RepID=UPI0026E12C6D|nr:hypothetical protein [Cellulophaga lytica]MDO6853674.1 hypothetical protein [Cellulophaga lytica]